MSEERISRISVRLLDREYQVACPAEERSDLLDSAEYVDAKMKEVRDSGKVVGLDRRIDELVATVGQLKEENRALRQRQELLMNERAGLLQKNEQVRARVEAMIGRLKSMEQGS